MATSAPRTPPKKGETIEQQITSAISQGFSTVLNDLKAQNAEMLKALKDISHKGSMVARSTGSARNASVASEERPGGEPLEAPRLAARRAGEAKPCPWAQRLCRRPRQRPGDP